MKKVIYLLLATLMVASCTKEEIIEAPKGKGRLNITLTSDAPRTRATGGGIPAASDEKTIQRVVVGIFDSTDAVNVIQEFDASELTANTTEKITCTAGPNQTVIVVANAPTGHFNGIATKSAFIAKTVTLEGTTMAAGYGAGDYQTATSLPMSGYKDIEVTVPTASDEVQSVAVSISRLVSRISIEEIYADIEAGCTFKVTGIELRNVATTSNVEPGTSFPVTSDIKNDADPVDYEWLKHEFKTLTPISSGNATTNILAYNKVWFYAFANDTTQTHKDTRLVITGDFYDGVASSTRYYPVSVNAISVQTKYTKQDGTEINDPSDPTTSIAEVGDGNIHRNYSYRIKATIKGKGNTNIDEPYIPAKLEVAITPEDWVLDFTQAVEFE
jgi:hypothetical protein